MSVEVIYTSEPAGTCPVQAEGTINGYPFYFRSRHARWSMRIASSKEGDPFNNDALFIEEDYPTKEDQAEHRRVSAGYASKEECTEFIERCAENFILK